VISNLSRKASYQWAAQTNGKGYTLGKRKPQFKKPWAKEEFVRNEKAQKANFFSKRKNRVRREEERKKSEKSGKPPKTHQLTRGGGTRGRKKKDYQYSLKVDEHNDEKANGTQSNQRMKYRLDKVLGPIRGEVDRVKKTNDIETFHLTQRDSGRADKWKRNQGEIHQDVEKGCVTGAAQVPMSDTLSEGKHDTPIFGGARVRIENGMNVANKETKVRNRRLYKPKK